MFEIGQKVKVVDGLYAGEVTKIVGNQVTFIDDIGFEYTFQSHQLILDQMGSHKIEVSKKNLKSKNNSLSEKIKKLNKSKLTIEVDLHADKLSGIHTNFNKHDIYIRQLTVAEENLNKIQSKSIQSIVLIHGLGNGKLREGIEKLCIEKGFKYSQAPFYKYGEGAIEVFKKYD